MAGRTVYIIQHLQGYDGDEQYRKNERRLKEAGFIRCRSERDAEGKYWEVWLGLPWALNGQLREASPDFIIEWLMSRAVGEISIAVEKRHLGAALAD